jgi:two-component system NarL family sensor kinase
MKYCFLILLFAALTCSGQAGREFLNRGDSAYEKGDYAVAITCFEQAIDLAGSEYTVEVTARNSLGNALCMTGKPDEGMKHYMYALKIAEKHDDKLNMIKVQKNIGTLYSEQKDFDNALACYYKALDFATSINHQPLAADCYNNIGVILEQREQYTEALELYKKALHIYTKERNRQRTGMTLNNLAIVYKYLKDYPNAILNYNRSIAISGEIGDQFMQAANQNNLGNVYAETGDYRNSLKLCMLANNNAKAIKAQEIIVESYDGIATAYEKMGNYVKALEYRKLYDREKSDFINTERSAQVSNLKIAYETEQKEQQIQLLNQEKEISALKIKEQQQGITQRNQLLWLTGIVLITTIMSAWFWIKQLRLKHRLKQEAGIKETEQIERSRIAKDIHDELGSGLSKINLLSTVISRNTALSQEAQANIISIQNITRSIIGNMHHLIWALGPEDTTLSGLIIDMREYTSDYLEDFPTEIRYRIPAHIPRHLITKKSHHALSMVVKECINNIVKHAHASEITFEVEVGNTLRICIADNGTGMDNTRKHQGNGLRNMHDRITALGGSLRVEAGHERGTSIILEVPLTGILKV